MSEQVPPRRGRGRRTAAGAGTGEGESRQEPGGAPGAEAAGAAGPAPTERPFGSTFRDFLVPYILLALSLQRAHGYFIEQYLRGLGLLNVEMSTLYRTLRQLERDGLVFSTWEPGPEGPARRVYSLTDAGRWWLDTSAAALEGYRALIDRFFGSYSGPTRRSQGDEQERGASR